MLVYLIHFEEKFKHAQHYIGITDNDDVTVRCESHRKGTGSSLMKAVTNAGIKWSVVRTWQGENRTFERKMKNGKHSSRLCPICKQDKNETK